MTLVGLDAFGHPPAQAVVDGGFSFVMCYVGIPGNPKCVTRAQFEDYVAHGLRVGFVFESTAGRATEGFRAGVTDAVAAQDYIRDTLGVSDAPLTFYAVDADVTFPQVEPYFDGVDTVHMGDAYGDYQIVHELLGNNLVTEVWQTPAWSHGVLEPNRAVLQRVGSVVVGGVECDVDEAQQFGQWAYPKGPIVLNQDDANLIVQTFLNYKIPRMGVDENNQPEQGETNPLSIMEWWDAAVDKPYRELAPLMQQMIATLAELKAEIASGNTVALSASDRAAILADLRKDQSDAFTAAGEALGNTGTQQQ